MTADERSTAVCQYLWTYHGWVTRHVGPDFADDVVQEACAIALERIQQTEIEFIKGYCQGILRNLIFGVWRRRKRAPLHLDAVFLEDSEPRTAEDLERRVIAAEERAIAEEVLVRMPHPLQREIVRRAFFDGESKDETREALHLTETQYRLGKSKGKARFSRDLADRIRPAA